MNLKDKIQKNIDEIKAKIPKGFSLSSLLKKKDSPKTSSKENDEGVDSSTNTEKSKEKKKLGPIKIVLIGAMAYLAFDLVLNEKNEETQKITKKKNVEKKRPVSINREREKTEVQLEGNKDDVNNTLVNSGDEGSIPKEVESHSATGDVVKNDSPKEEFKAGQDSFLESSERPFDSSASMRPDNSVPVPTESVKKEDDAIRGEVDLADSPSPSSGVGEMADSLEDERHSGTQVETTSSLLEKVAAQHITESSNSEKSPSSEESFDPPKLYEAKGRGLVYNCLDKRWACTNETTYKKCHKHQQYKEKTGEASACSIFAVYDSVEDCEKVQQYNIEFIVKAKCD